MSARQLNGKVHMIACIYNLESFCHRLVAGFFGRDLEKVSRSRGLLSQYRQSDISTLNMMCDVFYQAVFS